MAKKKIIKKIKLQIFAGKATPAPPIGPALGSVGVNIMMFCKQFNAETQGKDSILPTEITVYHDKSFSFVTREPPVAELIKKELGITSGSKVPNRDKVGKLTTEQLLTIVRRKKIDFRLRGGDERAAMRLVAGTARSMGVEVEQ